VTVRLLLRGQLRTRRRRQAALAAAFAVGLLAALLFASVGQGAAEAVVAPTRSLMSGDARVTNGTTDIASGTTWDDARPVHAALDRIPGAHASMRMETTYVTVRGLELANWSAGLLLGIDPADPAEREALDGHLVWGQGITAIGFVSPVTSRSLPPIVLGEPAATRLNLSLGADGQPLWGQVLTLTSGTTIEGTEPPVPRTIEMVVVGVYRSGLEPLDRFTAFIPIQTARTLVGLNENDPAANAIIVRGTDAPTVRQHLADDDLLVESANEFSFGYLGTVMTIAYAAGVLAAVLFALVLLTWLLHETSMLVTGEAPVVASLRAIGVGSGTIQNAYAALMAGTLAVGAAVALVAYAAALLLSPSIVVHVEGFTAPVTLAASPMAVLASVLFLVVAATAGAWLAARRLRSVDLLASLRRP
jgi:ABC-type lipoprotein release transport system permease subunit